MDIKIEEESFFGNGNEEEEIKSGSSDFKDIKIEEEEIKTENLYFKNEIIEEEIKNENWVTFKNEIYFKEEDFWLEENVDCNGNSFCSFSEEKDPRNIEGETQPSVLSNIGNHETNRREIEQENIEQVGWKSSMNELIHLSNKVKQKRYHCNICECDFGYKYQLLDHAASVHGKEKPFKCKECDYSCSIKKYLVNHVNSVHRKEKPFKCGECEYSSSQNGHVTLHVKSVHRKEKPFKCPECDYSCSRNGKLILHFESVHRKEKPFKCT